LLLKLHVLLVPKVRHDHVLELTGFTKELLFLIEIDVVVLLVLLSMVTLFGFNHSILV